MLYQKSRSNILSKKQISDLKNYLRENSQDTNDEIADFFGLDPKTIGKYRRKFGIKSSITERNQKIDSYLKKYHTSKSDLEISQIFDVSPKTVRERRGVLGLPAFKFLKVEIPKRYSLDEIKNYIADHPNQSNFDLAKKFKMPILKIIGLKKANPYLPNFHGNLFFTFMMASFLVLGGIHLYEQSKKPKGIIL